MRLEFGRDDQELIADAVPRSTSSLEHFAPRGELAFPNAREWEKARKLLEAVGSEGGRANLGPGTMRLERIPAPFDELLGEGMQGTIRVRGHRVVPPWAAAISVDTDQGKARLDVDLVPEEPEDDWDAKLVGRGHGLAVEMRFVWSHSEQSGELNLTWHFTHATGAVDERAAVLAFLVALHGSGTFEIRDREQQRPELRERTVPAVLPDEFRYLRRLYEDLATVQGFAGATFGPPPDEATYEEARELAWLADALRAGGYEATMHSAHMRCGPESLAAFRRSGSDIEVRETLCARFFGRELPVAQQSVKLPLMTVKQAIRVTGRDPLWDVELVPALRESLAVDFKLAPLEDAAESRVA